MLERKLSCNIPELEEVTLVSCREFVHLSACLPACLPVCLPISMYSAVCDAGDICMVKSTLAYPRTKKFVSGKTDYKHYVELS